MVFNDHSVAVWNVLKRPKLLQNAIERNRTVIKLKEPLMTHSAWVRLVTQGSRRSKERERGDDGSVQRRGGDGAAMEQ